MRVYFNSRDEFYRHPFGAVRTSTEITFRLKVIDHIKGLKCYVAMWQDDKKLPEIEMEKESEANNEVIYVAKFKTPKEPALIWYHFILQSFDEKFFYSNNDLQSGGEGKLVDNSPKSYQITVYKDDKTPEWFKEGIVYQIFPDRFNRGEDYEERKANTLKRIEGKNHGKTFVDDWYKDPEYNRDENGGVYEFEFYGGTLKGIEEKLPYLKSLGVTCIYLNPIFEARSNHRYDTGDYMKIDSFLGDDKSFKSLVHAAKKEGIGIMLDGVFSHQGADSIYFNKFSNYDSVGAYNSENSKYHPWYNFIKFPDQYESWWGVSDLPEVNEMYPTYLDFICKGLNSVIKHWMRAGIVGFRLDVADELPDEFIVEVRKAMDRVNKDSILVGEVWEDATNKVSYDQNRKYFINASLKSVMNYPFMESVINFMEGHISAYELSEFFYKQMENYPSMYFNSNLNLVDGHDRVRIITQLSDSRDVQDVNEDEKKAHTIDRDKYLLAVSRLKALSVIQYTVPGTPLLYYGDEVGVYGYNDPYNRKPYPWGREDNELCSHYIALGEMRKKSKVFADGTFKTLFTGTHTFAYERATKDEKIVVIVNRGIFYNEGEQVVIDLRGREAEDLLSGEKIEMVDNKLVVDMNPLGYKVLKIS